MHNLWFVNQYTKTMKHYNFIYSKLSSFPGPTHGLGMRLGNMKSNMKSTLVPHVNITTNN